MGIQPRLGAAGGTETGGDKWGTRLGSREEDGTGGRADSVEVLLWRRACES